jgi:hypothetical protein
VSKNRRHQSQFPAPSFILNPHSFIEEANFKHSAGVDTLTATPVNAKHLNIVGVDLDSPTHPHNNEDALLHSEQHSYLDGHRGLNDPLLMELGPTSTTAKKPKKPLQSPMQGETAKGGFKIIGYGQNSLMMTTNKFNFKKVTLS